MMHRQTPSPPFSKGSTRIRFLLTGLLLSILGFGLFLPTPQAFAQSGFSIPSINSIKKKLFKTHKKRHRKRKKKNTKPTASQEPQPEKTQGKADSIPQNPAPTAATIQPDQLPPLPVRKPRLKPAFLKAEKNTDKRAPAKKAPVFNLLNVALPPLPERKPMRHPSQIDDGIWKPQLITDAKQLCQRLGIKTAPLAPIKEGRCGNPAPILIAEIAGVKLRPAATLSCPMISALDKWLANSVQLEAKALLGRKIVALRNVSSYVCRNRYGDTKTRISEHAFANALDIAYFELEGGEKVSILGDWVSGEGKEKKSAFLKAVHKSACGPFGTVLGPEANAAHKDHFHLDKAPRKRSAYCR